MNVVCNLNFLEGCYHLSKERNRDRATIWVVFFLLLPIPCIVLPFCLFSLLSYDMVMVWIFQTCWTGKSLNTFSLYIVGTGDSHYVPFLTTLSEVKLFECNKNTKRTGFVTFVFGGVSSLQIACETVNFVLYIFVVLPINNFGTKKKLNVVHVVFIARNNNIKLELFCNKLMH